MSTTMRAWLGSESVHVEASAFWADERNQLLGWFDPASAATATGVVARDGGLLEVYASLGRQDVSFTVTPVTSWISYVRWIVGLREQARDRVSGALREPDVNETHQQYYREELAELDALVTNLGRACGLYESDETAGRTQR